MYGRINEIESIYEKKINSLEHNFVIAKLGIKLDRGLFWVNFEAPFAYYRFSIGKTVKTRGMGINKNFNKESLNTRFTSY